MNESMNEILMNTNFKNKMPTFAFKRSDSIWKPQLARKINGLKCKADFLKKYAYFYRYTVEKRNQCPKKKSMQLTVLWDMPPKNKYSLNQE